MKVGQIFESHSVAGHWKYSEDKHVLSIAAGVCPRKKGGNGCSLSPRKELKFLPDILYLLPSGSQMGASTRRTSQALHKFQSEP